MNTTVLKKVGASDASTNVEAKTYAKVVWRIIPLLFLCYILSYLDRVNVGFAKLQMMNDLQFSETVYGIGAGVFFIGYFLFEVPSNLILHRVGARRWIARIMITWGLISTSMMFVSSPTTFYVLRFCLGIAEAGFFPGIILYLTFWFPSARRGQMTALFMTGIPIAGVFGGPLSGYILENMAGAQGMAGWQWLFLLEGVPTVFAGFLVLAYLDDRIEDAKWLSNEEKVFLRTKIDEDDAGRQHGSAWSAITNPQVWLLCLVYFCLIMGLYGVSFWLPTIIKAMGVQSATNIGFIYAIPYLAAAIGMVLIGRSADKRRERRWHIVVPCLLGAIGLVLSVYFSHTPALAIASLSIATLGIISALPLFWSCPTALLGGAAAAGGIAFINSMGNLAGFVSPYMVGFIKDATQSTDSGMYVLAGCLLIAGVLVIATFPARLVNK
jgi:D-galactonate transporter